MSVAGKQIQHCWFELGNVEHRMNCMKLGGESQGKRVGTWGTNDFIWS